MARVGFNSAVQGRADIPQGANKLIIIFPKIGSNRSEKRLEKLADKLTMNGYGTLLMDLWDEEEGRIAYELSQDFLLKRVKEIIGWAKEYKNFMNLDLILMGVDTTGDTIKEIQEGIVIKIDESEDLNRIVERVNA
jgi:hypothetical protein